MTLDAADLQAIGAIGAIGGLILAHTTLIVTLLGGWTFWLVRDLRREMDRNRQEMTRNHREVLALLGSHTHRADDARPVFHDLPDAADGD